MPKRRWPLLVVGALLGLTATATGRSGSARASRRSGSKFEKATVARVKAAIERQPR